MSALLQPAHPDKIQLISTASTIKTKVTVLVMAWATQSSTWVSPSPISLRCLSILASSHPGPSDVCTHHPLYCYSLSYSAFPLLRLFNSHSDSRSQGSIILPPRRHQNSLFTSSYGKMSLLLSRIFYRCNGFGHVANGFLPIRLHLIVLKKVPAITRCSRIICWMSASMNLPCVFPRQRPDTILWDGIYNILCLYTISSGKISRLPKSELTATTPPCK